MRKTFFFKAAKWDTPQMSYYGLVNTEVSEPLMVTDCVLCVRICRHAAFPLLIKGCAFLIVFVGCYFIKVGFKMSATVYVTLCVAHEHAYMCGLCGCVHMFKSTYEIQTVFHF